jgi:tetratricopeptide (TPR) repeat protein
MDSTADPEQKLEEIADKYLSALQAGGAVNRATILASHPELGSSLDRRLALVEKVFRAARRADTPNIDELAPKKGGGADSAEEESNPKMLADASGFLIPAKRTEPGEATEQGPLGLRADYSMRFRCPHCGNPIQLVAPNTHEVTCLNCGSTFEVDPWATTSYRPIRLPKQIGKFTVLELLGRGGFGAVYKARDTELKRIVAVKVPRAGYFTSQEEEERFFREARHLARLTHPAIVPVFEIARVTASEDYSLRVWDAKTGKAVTPAMSHDGTVLRAYFSSNDQYLVSASVDHTARIWNASTGEQITTLKHSREVWWAVFFPRGGRVITTSLDGAARVWDVSGERMAFPPLLHSNPNVYHAAFSVDGRMVATSAGGQAFHVGPNMTREGEWLVGEPGVASGEGRLWDSLTGELLAPPMRHAGRVIHTSFHQDGRRIATASYDQTARVWDISPDDRPAEDLVSLARLLSGHRIDDVGGFVPLTSNALGDLWATLRAKYPTAFTCSTSELTAWHRKQMERCRQSRNWTASIGHIDQLISLQPNDPTAVVSRARTLAELGQWEASVIEFTKVTENGIDDERVWCDLALATLASDDISGYKQVCARLLDRFGDRVTTATTTLMARACIVRPNAVADAAAPLKLAEEAVDQDPENNLFLTILGAALYRAGAFDGAIRRLTEAIETTKAGGTVEDWLFLAMAMHQASRPDDARYWLHKATELMDRRPDNQSRDATSWQDRLIRKLLRQEAESLLGA